MQASHTDIGERLTGTGSQYRIYPQRGFPALRIEGHRWRQRNYTEGQREFTIHFGLADDRADPEKRFAARLTGESSRAVYQPDPATDEGLRCIGPVDIGPKHLGRATALPLRPFTVETTGRGLLLVSDGCLVFRADIERRTVSATAIGGQPWSGGICPAGNRNRIYGRRHTAEENGSCVKRLDEDFVDIRIWRRRLS